MELDKEEEEEDYLLSVERERIPISYTRTPLSQNGEAGEVMTIHDLRERIEQERNRSEQESKISYQAGLAEVSSNVLHNIGNVITGLTGRSEQIHEGVEDLQLIQQQLEQAASLDQLPILQQGITKTAYLMDEIIQKSLRESGSAIRTGVDHIAEVIAIQQELARGTSVGNNRFQLTHVLRDVLSLYKESLKNNQIQFVQELSVQFDELRLPKNPFMQALSNLIKNAKESIQERQYMLQVERGEHRDREREPWSGEIRVCSIPTESGQLQIRVKDNGIGLEPELAKRVFHRGVSSKQQGSGFGLHSVATFAGSIGGSVHIESEGVNRGATVILTVPLNSSEGSS